MLSLATFTLVLLGSTSLVRAHCQLAWPYPLHSSLNPATPEAIKDYSMTSPLVTDGTYPCKGFINNPSSDMFSTVTWEAGSTYNYTIVGTATHGGGSCQLSMSYDQGETWNVILSIVGGCLIDGMTEEVTIPSEAPSGEALFSWAWFNREGNREMYQNCAVVTITNGGDGLTGPGPFVANAGVNECVTIENIDVVFPDPGPNVRYGGGYVTSQPTTPAGYTGSNCVGPGSTNSSSSGSGTATGTSSNTAGTLVSTSSSPAATTNASPLVAAAGNNSTSSNTPSTQPCKRNQKRKLKSKPNSKRALSGVERSGRPRAATKPTADSGLARRADSGVVRGGRPRAATRIDLL